MSLVTTLMSHQPQCGAELGTVGAERGGFGVQGSQAGAGDGNEPPLGVDSSKAGRRCTQGVNVGVNQDFKKERQRRAPARPEPLLRAPTGAGKSQGRTRRRSSRPRPCASCPGRGCWTP